MKVESFDPIMVQRQFRRPQPLLKAAQDFDPLGEIIREIRRDQQAKQTELPSIHSHKVDIKA